jgi:hypothetical protein
MQVQIDTAYYLCISAAKGLKRIALPPENWMSRIVFEKSISLFMQLIGLNVLSTGIILKTLISSTFACSFNL